MAGPLDGIKVVEMAAIGPAPFCAMMLSDMGAQVIRIAPPTKNNSTKNAAMEPRFDVLARGRRVLNLDMKNAQAQEVALTLIAQADVLVEGFRPGVMERLGLGPDVCFKRNARLIYGRMTGWGQSGPLAQAAGHDINYIALSGMLHAMGRTNESPAPPLNLVGDFGGGGMMLAFGIACALVETKRSQQGQVIDAAMTDGSALLGTMMYGLKSAGRWSIARGTNLLDGGAHFYDTYVCADDKYIAIGAIEPQFYAELIQRLGLDASEFLPHPDPQQWPALKQKVAAHIKTKTRDEWSKLLEGSDACFAPVLDMDEAPLHPHNLARGTFVEVDGVIQPAAAPRYSRTPAKVQRVPQSPGEDVERILRDWGFDAERIARLKADGII